MQQLDLHLNIEQIMLYNDNNLLTFHQFIHTTTEKQMRLCWNNLPDLHMVASAIKSLLPINLQKYHLDDILRYDYIDNSVIERQWLLLTDEMTSINHPEDTYGTLLLYPPILSDQTCWTLIVVPKTIKIPYDVPKTCYILQSALRLPHNYVTLHQSPPQLSQPINMTHNHRCQVTDRLKSQIVRLTGMIEKYTDDIGYLEHQIGQIMKGSRPTEVQYLLDRVASSPYDTVIVILDNFYSSSDPQYLNGVDRFLYNGLIERYPNSRLINLYRVDVNYDGFDPNTFCFDTSWQIKDHYGQSGFNRGQIPGVVSSAVNLDDNYANQWESNDLPSELDRCVEIDMTVINVIKFGHLQLE